MSIRYRLVFFVSCLFAAHAGLATDYYADAAGGAWDANTTWHVGSPSGPQPAAGTYPGSASGDSAFLTAGGTTVTVGTFIPNDVILSVTSPCTVNISSGGGRLAIGDATVDAAAAISNSGTFEVNAIGTVFIDGVFNNNPGVSGDLGVSVNSGTLALRGGGTGNAPFAIA